MLSAAKHLLERIVERIVLQESIHQSGMAAGEAYRSSLAANVLQIERMLRLIC